MLDGGLRRQGRAWRAGWSPGSSRSIYTGVLSLFPALMYFQFDRQRVGTIRGRWVRAIFRMDHQMETLADVDARYGDQLAEASSCSTDSVPLPRRAPLADHRGHDPGRRSAGRCSWSARTRSTSPAPTRSSRPGGVGRPGLGAGGGGRRGDRNRPRARAPAADAAADEAARRKRAAAAIAAESTGDTVPSTPTTGPSRRRPARRRSTRPPPPPTPRPTRPAAAEATVQQPFFQLLVPTPSAATMAFLGAYFFAVYLVLRGYFRGDLRPKLYNQITARLVTVVVLAYLLTILYAGDGETNRFLWPSRSWPASSPAPCCSASAWRPPRCRTTRRQEHVPARPLHRSVRHPPLADPDRRHRHLRERTGWSPRASPTSRRWPSRIWCR